MAETTPMMEQYSRIKDRHKDTVLFFRLGDFYEMFKQDAVEISALLNLTLTKRNGIPMCGIPYHAAHSYIARLLKAGKKIAICEQMGVPKPGKNLVDRDVIEIITPGTVLEEDFLDKTSNNYILALGAYKEFLSLAWVDLSTGEFKVSAIPFQDTLEGLKKEFLRLRPKEIVIQESLLEENTRVNAVVAEQASILVNRYPDWYFDMHESRKRLLAQFGVANLKGFGISDDYPGIFVCGMLLQYLEDTSKNLLSHIRSVAVYKEEDYVGMDESTQKNLELVSNLHDGTRRYSLLDVLDFTKTAMGSRMLRQWIVSPLNRVQRIKERQKRIEELYRNQGLLSSLRNSLGSMLDLERLSARVAMDKAHAKDLLAIGQTLCALKDIENLLNDIYEGHSFWSETAEDSRTVETVRQLIADSIADEPSILINEGNIIRDGFHAELDALRNLKSNSREVLERYLEKEREASGIPNLRIRYNKIIGYYIEITKSHLNLVPGHFIRRQSLVGGERYTTNRLIELETELNSASERIIELERTLFLEIRNTVKQTVPLLLRISDHIAHLDCYQSLAQAATVRGYVMPEISEAGEIFISEGRHPVVEAHMRSGEFIPNSIHLKSGEKSFALITGPNMAGKSTFLRQTALITLMAQMGGFVPAESARIGIVDKIFCRVGAQDNLARGESTFLVEMNETANILRAATERSLVIMDEVGRGTSTNDGLAIAWAVSEYMLNVLHAKTLFATHYHELTRIEHEQLMNLSMEVLETKGEIVFLKRVINGAAENSYGIHVAKLAGLPEQVIARAESILSEIVKKERNLPAEIHVSAGSSAKQQELFSPQELVCGEIRAFDLNRSTPLECMHAIERWKRDIG